MIKIAQYEDGNLRMVTTRDNLSYDTSRIYIGNTLIHEQSGQIMKSEFQFFALGYQAGYLQCNEDDRALWEE